MPRVIETSSFRRETDIRHTEGIKCYKHLNTRQTRNNNQMVTTTKINTDIYFR